MTEQDAIPAHSQINSAALKLTRLQVVLPEINGILSIQMEYIERIKYKK
jgi:hypothetical protein